MSQTPDVDRVAQAAAEAQFNRMVSEASHELTLYDNRWKIMDCLEKAGHGLKLAEIAMTLVSMYGVRDQQTLLDSIDTCKAEILKFGDELSDLVTRIEDQTDA